LKRRERIHEDVRRLLATSIRHLEEVGAILNQLERPSAPPGPDADLSPARHKLLVMINEAAELLSVSRTVLYTLVQHREIASIKIGRARRIPVRELQRFVDDELELSR